MQEPAVTLYENCVFPVNDFPVFLITKCFMMDVKGFLDSPLLAIH